MGQEATAFSKPEDRADVAHALRKLTFGPFPGQVERLAAKGNGRQAASKILETPAPVIQPPDLGSDDDERLLTDWWIARMADPNGGLHEKMTWFWHTLLTSGFDKVSETRFMWRQHALLRRFALGNFRSLMQAITIDAAMLQYLDGAQSTGEAPNENYARELMELFTMGRGSYTEADVRAASRALAGWTIDDRGTVRFDPARAHNGTVSFLGRTGRFSARDIVNIVCDNAACAPYITRRIHRFLLGYDPSPQRTDELAQVFRRSNLEIRPLVAAMVEHESFWEPPARYSRARHPVEWLAPASAVLGRALEDLDPLYRLGQVPFRPANVGGWPDTGRWLAAGPSMIRATTAWGLAHDTFVEDVADPVAWALERASIFDPSDTTKRALDVAARSVESRRERASLLLSLAVCSPEFVLT